MAGTAERVDVRGVPWGDEGGEEAMKLQGVRRRSFLDWLLRRPRYIDITHVMFLARCADGDMAVRFGRPDVCVVDLERMVSVND